MAKFGTWIKTKCREAEREELEMYPEFLWYVCGETPDDGEEIIVSHKNGKWIDFTVFHNDDGVYCENDWDWIDDIAAWMPTPKPFEETDGE